MNKKIHRALLAFFILFLFKSCASSNDSQDDFYDIRPLNIKGHYRISYQLSRAERINQLRENKAQNLMRQQCQGGRYEIRDTRVEEISKTGQSTFLKMSIFRCL